MRKINILYCVEYLSSGGTEKQLMSLINGLNSDKFQPHLCCLRNSMIGKDRRKQALDFFYRIQSPKIQLDFISFLNVKSLIEIARLASFMKNHKIDIVQTYFQDPAALGLLAAKLCGIRHVIASFRDLAFWRKNENDWKMEVIYKLCSAYLANSSAVRTLFSNLYRLPEERFTLIYNGIDIERFTSLDRKAEHEPKDIVVGIVANLSREVKRVDIFLKSAAYVLQRIQGVRFVVAGDGELREDLIKLSGDLGISRKVDFLCTVKNIPRLLSTVHIGVISSDSEGFSNSILEYMAAGVAVVATDVGGNIEIIQDSVNGYLVPSGNFRIMGKKIIDLASNKFIHHKMTQAAYQTIRKDYTLKHCIERYESYYEKILFERD